MAGVKPTASPSRWSGWTPRASWSIAVAAIVAVAVAGILWLPLDSDVEADVREALVGYEVSRQVAWPAAEPLTLPLPGARQAALAGEVERGLSDYATGAALARFDAARAVRSFVAASVLGRPWVVTGWDGELVYFDFVRQTLYRDVIVRAGVRRAHQIGRSNVEKGRVVGRRWRWADGADIYEYTLHDDGEVWKVKAAKPWGVCDARGENVIEGHTGL